MVSEPLRQQNPVTPHHHGLPSRAVAWALAQLTLGCCSLALPCAGQPQVQQRQGVQLLCCRQLRRAHPAKRPNLARPAPLHMQNRASVNSW